MPESELTMNDVLLLDVATLRTKAVKALDEAADACAMPWSENLTHIASLYLHLADDIEGRVAE